MTLGLRCLRPLVRAGHRLRGVRRLSAAVLRRFAGRSRVVELDDFDGDLRLRLDLADHIESQIFWYGTYSTALLTVWDKLVRPDSVFLDVGANIGEHTLYVAKRAPRGRVFAFEPVAELFARLETNLRLNDLSQVTPVRAAVAEVEGEGEILVPKVRWVDGTIWHEGVMTPLAGHEQAGERERVRLLTLDRYAAEVGLERVDLVKMDIEGAELRALEGGRELLREHRPAMILEVNARTTAGAGYEVGDLFGFVRALGYRTYAIAPAGRVRACDETNHSRDILCLRAEASPAAMGLGVLQDQGAR